ncbi:MAG: DUF1002 domain-containing protein [Lachnospiraceae bacterium]|nr:DUF1002 domain-containing protein [Lachnospiraceae bacterium]
MRKRMVGVLLSLCMVMAMGTPVKADGVGNVNENGQAYLVTGADLSKDQWNKVIELLGVSEDELADYTQLEVTNAEEHQYLDQYLPASVIGSKAFSSVKMVPGEEGSGLDITTYNINYCTVSMYKNALITAGMEDAQVTIAGPFELSGTAALIGAVKAYADEQGESVDEEALKTATNELVTTGKLGDELGDADAAADLVAYTKQMVVEKGLEDEDDIKEAVREGAEKLNLDVSDEQVDKITDLMQDVSKLDLDKNVLQEQAEDLYNKLNDLGLNLDGINGGGVMSSVKEAFQSVLDFFKKLFG